MVYQDLVMIIPCDWTDDKSWLSHPIGGDFMFSVRFRLLRRRRRNEFSFSHQNSLCLIIVERESIDLG